MLRFPLDGTVDVGYDSTGASVNLTNIVAQSIIYVNESVVITGANANSAVTTYSDTTYGDVATFDRTAFFEYTHVPATAFGSNTRCYSSWVKPVGSSMTLFSTGIQDGNGGLFRVSLTASLKIYVEYGYSGQPNSTTTSALGSGTWWHVVISYDGSNVNCFINGTLALTDPRSLDTTQSALTIGGDHTPFSGFMSDFRLYDNHLSAEDITDLYQRGPNELLNINQTELSVFERDGIQPEVVWNDGVVAVGNVTTRDLNLVSEKAEAGETEVKSSVYLHDVTTSERVCISEQVHTVDENDTECVVSVNLSRVDDDDNRSMQTCLQYGGESVGIHAASSAGDATTSTINFEGLSFDSDDAAVVLGPFSEFRMRYDDATDTLQIQHLEDGVYKTKVQYSR